MIYHKTLSHMFTVIVVVPAVLVALVKQSCLLARVKCTAEAVLRARN